MVELGGRARTLFCVLFFGSETVLVATAGMRSDRSYGFRMFPESSTIVVHVSRRLDGGRLVPIEHGSWQTHDCAGGAHTLRWMPRKIRPIGISRTTGPRKNLRTLHQPPALSPGE